MVYTTGRIVFWCIPVFFVLVFLRSFWRFGVLALLGEVRGLSACFACVCLFCTCWFCHFSLLLGKRGWLRFEVVALPGLFY